MNSYYIYKLPTRLKYLQNVISTTSFGLNRTRVLNFSVFQKNLAFE